MSQSEMPIFTRSFDFLTWLLPMTHHFPRNHRHDFTQRLLERGLRPARAVGSGGSPHGS